MTRPQHHPAPLPPAAHQPAAHQPAPHKPAPHRPAPHQHWALHPQLASDSHPIAAFTLCELRLMDDANYPWLVLVPRVAEAIELIDLDTAQQTQLMAEIGRASRALQTLFRPHKLNVAALGNVVPQLHVHVIARQLDDPAWPTPVWGRVQARSYEPEALVERVRQLQATLGT